MLVPKIQPKIQDGDGSAGDALERAMELTSGLGRGTRTSERGCEEEKCLIEISERLTRR